MRQPQWRSGGRWRAAALLTLLAMVAACTGAKLPETEVTAGDDGGFEASEGGPATTSVDGILDPDAPGVPPVPGASFPGSGDTAVPGATGTPGAPQPATGGPGGAPQPGEPGQPGQPAPGPTATAPPPPRTQLFSAAEDRIGITDKEIRICVHAALTYGAAFNTGEADLNVYWQAVNDVGGVHGRQVKVFYENDNYSPDTAVQAATACKDRRNPFLLVGGIGFDQIPAVRGWAERNRMPYLHHTATEQGTSGQQFSYSSLPTTEKMGEMFAELAISRFKGKRIGIIKRDSPNWEPGVVGFKRLAARHNLDITYEKGVQVNQGAYLQEILAMRDKVDVVWVWLNGLETTEFVKQAKAQGLNATFMVFPFNLESQTLGDDALDPPMVGVGMYQAYSKGDLSGEFAKYADDIRQFEAQYAKYRPSADLEGLGGDLIFLAWSGYKSLHTMLEACGPDCTRNRLLDVMKGLKARPTSSFCEVDFTRADPHLGGYQVSVMETYRAPSGKVNWRNTHTCVEHLVG